MELHLLLVPYFSIRIDLQILQDIIYLVFAISLSVSLIPYMEDQNSSSWYMLKTAADPPPPLLCLTRHDCWEVEPRQL